MTGLIEQGARLNPGALMAAPVPEFRCHWKGVGPSRQVSQVDRIADSRDSFSETLGSHRILEPFLDGLVSNTRDGRAFDLISNLRRAPPVWITRMTGPAVGSGRVRPETCDVVAGSQAPIRDK
ncbi:hypothetical protein XU06_29595 (plasmid) [Rhodococcus erythropolis]|nr:hypothetical protein XU06_29595 [Rhodococcus erythropolis]